MKTWKLLRNIALLLWFGWFALSGIVVTGLLVWLTPLSMSGLAVLAWGSLAGVLLGATVAVVVLAFIWRRIATPVMSGLAFVRLLREQVLYASGRYRF